MSECHFPDFRGKARLLLKEAERKFRTFGSGLNQRDRATCGFVQCQTHRKPTKNSALGALRGVCPSNFHVAAGAPPHREGARARGTTRLRDSPRAPSHRAGLVRLPPPAACGAAGEAGGVRRPRRARLAQLADGAHVEEVAPVTRVVLRDQIFMCHVIPRARRRRAGRGGRARCSSSG